MTQPSLFVPTGQPAGRRKAACEKGRPCPDCHRSQKSRPPDPQVADWMAPVYQLSIAGLRAPVGRVRP